MARGPGLPPHPPIACERPSPASSTRWKRWRRDTLSRHGGNGRRAAALLLRQARRGRLCSLPASGRDSMLRTVLAISLLATAVLASSGHEQPAWAQNPLPAPPTAQPAPVGPPNSTTPPPERIEPTNPQTTGRREGTVRPPSDIDPGIAVAPLGGAQGTMPVVPPPGAPGGNPNVIPK